MVTTVGVREMRVRLAEFVARAERGETVVITRGGREVRGSARHCGGSSGVLDA